MRKATDEQIAETYRRTGSIWKAGEELGMCGQSVQERLAKMGISRDATNRPFSEKDAQRLKDVYVIYRNAGKLQELADEMGRTKQFICRKARCLGLTDRNHRAPWQAKWEFVSDELIADEMNEWLSSDMTLVDYCAFKGMDDLGFSREAKRRFPAEWDAIAELKLGSNNTYRRGRDFEYYVKRQLDGMGYVTFRAPASKGPADVVAISKGAVYFIQCKIGGYIGVDEWNEIMDYADRVGAIPLMATKGDNGRGARYFRLTGRKDGSKSRQPMVEFEFDMA